MLRTIKYKRITGTYNSNSLDELFNDLISEGFEIIYYNEKDLVDGNIYVTILSAKRQENKI